MCFSPLTDRVSENVVSLLPEQSDTTNNEPEALEDNASSEESGTTHEMMGKQYNKNSEPTEWVSCSLNQRTDQPTETTLS